MAEPGEHYRTSVNFVDDASAQGPASTLVVTSDRLLLLPARSNPPAHDAIALMEGPSFDRLAALPGALSVSYPQLMAAKHRPRKSGAEELTVKYRDAAGKRARIRGFVKAKQVPVLAFQPAVHWDETEAMIIAGYLSEPIENRRIEKADPPKDE